MPINGETNKTFTPSSAGSYALVASDNYGCKDTSECISVLTANINNNIENNVTIHPNPFSDYTTIKFNNNTWAKIEIVDLLGQVVWSTVTNESEVIVNREKMKSGVYFVNITNNKIKFTKKIIVE